MGGCVHACVCVCVCVSVFECALACLTDDTGLYKQCSSRNVSDNTACANEMPDRQQGRQRANKFP